MAQSRMLPCLLLLAATPAAAAAPPPPLPSILHVIIDDLRPELGAYGLEDRHTPHIDKLAKGVSKHGFMYEDEIR